ncbi:MAG: glycosyltransferase [Rhodoferax sp.]
MKVLVAGDWHSELHEEVVAAALRRLGHAVDELRWCRFFEDAPGSGSPLARLARRAQNKYLVGPVLARVNRQLQQQALAFQPDVVFIYRGTHIRAATLRALKRALPQCVLVGYNNDDPFSPEHPRYLWRHFLAAVPHYDLVLAYRHVNIDEYRRAGAQRVALLRSWYVPQRNYPAVLTPAEQAMFDTDVVFVGHYEADQRLDFLEEVVRQGFRLRLFGPGYDWDPVLRQSAVLRHLVPVRLVWGEEYNRALCGARIALCFFSKLNRDTYTRRCFEIPASGSLLLSEHSDDLAGLYREGVEADFFRSRDEMIAKIRHYLGAPQRRDAVAAAGRARVQADGHDVDSRMRQVLQWADAIRAGHALPISDGFS